MYLFSYSAEAAETSFLRLTTIKRQSSKLKVYPHSRREGSKTPITIMLSILFNEKLARSCTNEM
jgi:hypothetical protein